MFTEIPAPTLADVGGRSITLNIDEPPALDSDPPRNISAYSVTLTPQDGDAPQTVIIPAEAGNYTIPGLKPETMYDIDILPVIETEGQDEPSPYDLGIPSLSAETSELSNFGFLFNFKFCLIPNNQSTNASDPTFW